MRKRRSEYLSDFVSNQYPIETLKSIIFAVLDLVENFIIILNEERYLNSASISNYEERLGSFQRITSSKVESMCINTLHTELKMKDFIRKYGNALNSLNQEEKAIFIYTFIKKYDNLTILSKLRMHPVQLNTIRKSAIVRFSIKLGLERFVSLFNKNVNLELKKL